MWHGSVKTIKYILRKLFSKLFCILLSSFHNSKNRCYNFGACFIIIKKNYYLVIFFNVTSLFYAILPVSNGYGPMKYFINWGSSRVIQLFNILEQFVVSCVQSSFVKATLLSLSSEFWHSFLIRFTTYTFWTNELSPIICLDLLF